MRNVFAASIRVLCAGLLAGLWFGVAGGAGDAEASLYKCQNRDGTVRYQQTPCNVGNRGTRLETHSPPERDRAYPSGGATWGDVRRAKAQCDEAARRSYGESDPRRQEQRARCMERVERACSDKNSSRCRSELRRTGRKVERARGQQRRATRASARSGAGARDLELSTAKASCHAWSGADPSYRTRQGRERACDALAAACRADRYGPECRQRIQQLQPR